MYERRLSGFAVARFTSRYSGSFRCRGMLSILNLVMPHTTPTQLDV